MKKALFFVVTLLLLSTAVAGYYHYYSYIFARRVEGKVVGVERVTENSIITTSARTPRDLIFSFAVAIQTASGEIVTASTEDRKWAVVEKGQCAEAEYLPYPPWELDKRGTYFGARLLKLYECP